MNKILQKFELQISSCVLNVYYLQLNLFEQLGIFRSTKWLKIFQRSFGLAIFSFNLFLKPTLSISLFFQNQHSYVICCMLYYEFLLATLLLKILYKTPGRKLHKIGLQFVDTLFIVRSRPNLLMCHVVINY